MNHPLFTSKQQAHAGYCEGIKVCFLRKTSEDLTFPAETMQSSTKAFQNKAHSLVQLLPIIISPQQIYLVKYMSGLWLIFFNGLFSNKTKKKPVFTVQLSSRHSEKQTKI